MGCYAWHPMWLHGGGIAIARFVWHEMEGILKLCIGLLALAGLGYILMVVTIFATWGWGEGTQSSESRTQNIAVPESL